MFKKPAVIIYKDDLLPPSATFVRSQAEALRGFIPYYAGSRFVPGLPLPNERTLVVNRGELLGKLREVSYKLWGVAPIFEQHIKKLNPILIHAHFGTDAARVLPLARALQIPLMVTFHGYDATLKDEYARRSFYSHRVYLRRKEALKREARLFVAVSEFIKRKLLDQGFLPEKLMVHYIGVDTEIFQPDLAVSREPVILFVGRLIEKKGCQYLIQAMARVQTKLPDAELVIIGDGPLRPELQKLATKLLHRHRFLGVQPPQVVQSWMNRARLHAAPSITSSTGDSEGLPLVILEAQAMGLPVVSSIHAGIPEAVIHGETGFLTTERDWEGLAEYMLLLLEDDALWQRFSVAGQRRIRSLFDLKKQTCALEKIYDLFIKEPYTYYKS